MGVDYTGAGPLYALGSGTITNVYNSGWPGGKFIGLKLDTGQYVYYAENLTPRVTVGQRVTAGQTIATAVGSYPYIEVGWAAPPGTGQTMAAATGESAAGQAAGDPGKYSTGYGVSMSNTIQSLGGPAGVLSPGGVQGSASAQFPSSSSASGQGCNLFTALIWMVWYALVKTQKCGWHVSSRKRRYRRSPHEKRDRSGCG